MFSNPNVALKISLDNKSNVDKSLEYSFMFPSNNSPFDNPQNILFDSNFDPFGQNEEQNKASIENEQMLFQQNTTSIENEQTLFQQNIQPTQNVQIIGGKNNQIIPPNSNPNNNKPIFSKLKVDNIPTKDIVPKIQNIVCTADLNCKLNLKEIALQLENCNYNAKKFPGLSLKLKEPKTTGVLFSSGKMVCLGAKTEEESKKACRIYGKKVKMLNYNASLKDFKIRNIMGSSNLGFGISLSKLFNNMKKRNLKVHYEPEIFPALIYHYLYSKNRNEQEGEEPNVTYLVYSSGNIVIIGAKKRNKIFDLFREVYPVLMKIKIN